MMGTARVSSLQATSDDTRYTGGKTVLNRISTSKISLVDMIAYGGIKPTGLFHDHSRNTPDRSIQRREHETCFEMPGHETCFEMPWSRASSNSTSNSTSIVGDQPSVPPIQIQRTGGQTKIGIGEILSPFDGPSDNRQPGESYAPNQYHTYEASHRRRVPSEQLDLRQCDMTQPLQRVPTSSEERTVQALQNASDLSQGSSQLVQPSEKDTTMNSSPTLHSIPPNQGYQEPHQQSMWVDNKSRPKSKAIAIKRNNRRPEECIAAGLSEASSEQMYDWATWRMYNRIVDHRRNQRQTMRTSLPPLVAMDHHANQMLPHPDMHAHRFESRGAADYIHDGEVFDLDF